MAVQLKNNAVTTLAADITSSATSITVADGSVFPTLSGSDYTYATFEDTNSNREIVKVTAISSNTLTVVRAQDNTTARAFSDGDKCELRITAALLNDIATQADTDTNTEYTAGSGITLTGTVFSNAAPDQTVALSGGTGITTSGTYPNFTITNSSPDQTVALTGAGATTISGTYPNFTISSTDTDTNTEYTAGSGITLTGTVFSNSAPDQTVTLTGAGDTTVSGTYPNFTISSSGGSIDGTTINPSAVQIGGTTVITSSREGSFATRAQFGGVDSVGNVSPPTDNTIVSGYGIVGNRATLYVTNSGSVQLGNGSTHNNSPGLTVSTGAVNLGSSRALQMNGTTVIDSSRNITVPNVYITDTNTRITDGSGNSVRVQTNSGYVEVGPQNTGYAHFQTDRGKFYFNKRITVDEGIVDSYNQDLVLRRAGNNSHKLTISGSGTTLTSYLHLPASGGITFYGDASQHHGIFSRNSSNTVADDILISSYGAVYIDLDSNSNNSSGADFAIGRHNSSAQFFNVSGESGRVTTQDIRLKSGYALERLSHASGHLEGSYNTVGANSYKSNPIYTIGSSYNPSDATLGNMYGIGYSHTNASFIGFAGSSGWGMYVASDGDARIYLSGQQGHGYFTGNVTAYASDRRLKTNIQSIDNALDKVTRIRGVEFDWVDDIASEYDFHPQHMHETGVIAQEIQAVIPDAVVEAPMNGNYTAKCGTDHGFLTVDKEKIVPLLIEAIKELKAEVDALKSQMKEKQ